MDRTDVKLEGKTVWFSLAAVFALCGGLYWIGYSVATINSSIGNLESRIISLEKVVKDGQDSNKELMSKLLEHENRITTLEVTTVKKSK